jgi:protein required for attachment to host cells
MSLPTGTAVAVADGESVRLFHNTGVKRVHLIEITAGSAAARPLRLRCAASHRLPSPDGRRLVKDDFVTTTTVLDQLSQNSTGH